MKKAKISKQQDELRSEYDLSKLKGGVRGKYYRRSLEGRNIVVIESELSKLFPNSASVNHALRLLADTATAAAGPKTRSAKPSSGAGRK